ncbi:IS1634 family transposase [Tissierella praeacuta]|uniref:IS1634 family transposase n=1 Tax=Tissierella praeacuta TaxID=43131 RepID=UPI00333ED796
MYVKQIFEKRTGRTFLTIVEGYREPGTGKVKQRTVMSIGYLDELEKEHDDPVTYYKGVAKKMTEEAKEASKILTFNFIANETIDASTVLRKNLGFAVLSYFYHQLEINKFFINRQRNLNIEYSLNNIFQMLVYSKVLLPCSKKASFENMDNYFLDFNFHINHIYRALDYFNTYKDDLLLHIHEMVRLNYGRDTSNVYYDVTNYYFEIKEPDDFRKKGVSKEHRTTPIVQMGLLMDNSSLPITYKLFEGNTNDSTTLMPVLDELKEDYNFGRVIVVADKGMNTGENIAYNIIHKNGYIYSLSVRGAGRELKDYVLVDEGYEVSSDGFKVKSRIVTTKIWVQNAKAKNVQVEIEQKQVAFYSPDYDKRSKHEREKAVEKAKKLIEKSGNVKFPAKGAQKYIASTPCDKETGEIHDELSDYHFVDRDKISEEEKYDGYYVIVTSELKMPNNEILDAYRNLWKIEKTFKITKSELKTRPVYLILKEHIEAHFLTCFVSLLLLRLLEKQTKHKYSTKELVNEMNNISGTYLAENYYMFDRNSAIVQDLGDLVGVDFTKHFMTIGEIKNILAK